MTDRLHQGIIIFTIVVVIVVVAFSINSTHKSNYIIVFSVHVTDNDVKCMPIENGMMCGGGNGIGHGSLRYDKITNQVQQRSGEWVQLDTFVQEMNNSSDGLRTHDFSYSIIDCNNPKYSCRGWK